jgi:hypothetical protein
MDDYKELNETLCTIDLREWRQLYFEEPSRVTLKKKILQ